MTNLEDALVNERPNCISSCRLTEAREFRLQSHLKHRLTELEGYYSLQRTLNLYVYIIMHVVLESLSNLLKS